MVTYDKLMILIIIGTALFLYLSVRARTGVSKLACLTDCWGWETVGGRRLRCRGWWLCYVRLVRLC